MSVTKIEKENLHKVTGSERQIKINHCGRIIEIINYKDDDDLIYWDVDVMFQKKALHLPCHTDLASLLYTVYEEIEKGTI